MAHSHQSRRSYLQSLGSQALVDLSDCCCFRSLPRLGELVDQILFERQVASVAVAAGSRDPGKSCPIEGFGGCGPFRRTWPQLLQLS
jgi:hypothetical protein